MWRVLDPWNPITCQEVRLQTKIYYISKETLPGSVMDSFLLLFIIKKIRFPCSSAANPRTEGCFLWNHKGKGYGGMLGSTHYLREAFNKMHLSSCTTRMAEVRGQWGQWSCSSSADAAAPIRCRDSLVCRSALLLERLSARAPFCWSARLPERPPTALVCFLLLLVFLCTHMESPWAPFSFCLCWGISHSSMPLCSVSSIWVDFKYF